MRLLVLVLFLTFSLADTVIIEGPADFQIIKIGERTFDDFTYNAEWNKIQQPQIDFLLGREVDFSNQFKTIKYNFMELADYLTAVDAGQSALANIDFGSIEKGHFSVGFGVGFSDTIKTHQGIAGGVGIKYNFGDIEVLDTEIEINGIAKGWSNGIKGSGGFGFTLDF